MTNSGLLPPLIPLDCPRTERTRIILVAAGSDCFGRHLLLAASHNRVSGSNGESVPNETMNPLFLFELIHTTVVPALMQNNWLFFALGIPGFTLAESADLS